MIKGLKCGSVNDPQGQKHWQISLIFSFTWETNHTCSARAEGLKLLKD